jgi:hypothetical protein
MPMGSRPSSSGSGASECRRQVAPSSSLIARPHRLTKNPGAVSPQPT